MPLHHWSRVDAGTFHAFHNGWIVHLQETLNGGLLPEGYYALSEQHSGRYIADVLTLHVGPPGTHPLPPPVGSVALAEAPPRVERKLTVSAAARSRRRTLTIRHVSGHRVVALLEIVSPANKDRPEHIQDFVSKVLVALDHKVHVTVADLFAPGLHDPAGMNGAIWTALDESGEPFELPSDAPLTFAAYAADNPLEIYLRYTTFGRPLPTVPLFLTPGHYVDLPLEQTYEAAFRGMPEVWRAVLESPATHQ
jgi:Protein of unknown function (DUF4058)